LKGKRGGEDRLFKERPPKDRPIWKVTEKRNTGLSKRKQAAD